MIKLGISLLQLVLKIAITNGLFINLACFQVC